MEIREPVHLKIQKGLLAEKVIAVGDPNRAQIFSEAFLSEARVVNTNRGLLSFTGKYGGIPLSIVTHGMGMPSAIIVFEELNMLGARTIVRVGTTGSLRKEVKIGDVVVATAAGHFNSSALKQYYPRDVIPPNSTSHELTAPLREELERSGFSVHVGPIISSDAFYAESEEQAEELGRLGFISIEMECAGLTALGWMRGFRTACVLYVTDSLVNGAKGLLGSEKVNRDMVKIGESVAKVLSTY
ncbi:MAG: purine-nucleoside phosphorylase [Fervidicoccaceae archaeon]